IARRLPAGRGACGPGVAVRRSLAALPWGVAPDARMAGRLGKVVRDLLRQDPGARPDAEAVMQRLSGTPLSRLAARLTAPRGAYPHPETEG
ncbi:hypothetical protein, partial [Methylobacterium indicum]|uniref:hypothetical protein n=1 Tax=Methylobacterium indicum TaxID=1775910 RepID=UPI000AA392B6